MCLWSQVYGVSPLLCSCRVKLRFLTFLYVPYFEIEHGGSSIPPSHLPSLEQAAEERTLRESAESEHTRELQEVLARENDLTRQLASARADTQEQAEVASFHPIPLPHQQILAFRPHKPMLLHLLLSPLHLTLPSNPLISVPLRELPSPPRTLPFSLFPFPLLPFLLHFPSPLVSPLPSFCPVE